MSDALRAADPTTRSPETECAVAATNVLTWRGDRGPLALLALLTVLLFRDVLFAGRIFYERDVHTYYYPYAEVFRRMLFQGTWPLWNPYVAFGQPLLANPQLETFYPLTWLILVLTPPDYYIVFTVFHVLLAAAGTYVLCRTLGLSRAAALAGGAVYATSGPLLSLVPNWLHLGSAAWLPWVLAAAERFVRRPSLARAAWWGTAAAMQLLAGSPDISFQGAMAAGLLLLAATARADGPARWRLLALAVVAGAVGAGLASAQWVPTLSAAVASSVSTLPESARTYWSVHPLHLLQTVLPVPLREMALGPVAEKRLFESREPFLFSLYLGLPAAAFVAAAAADRSTPRRGYLLCCAMLAALWALGRYTPAYHVLAELVPVLKGLRFPMKAMVLLAVVWSVLVAAGVDGWRRGGRPARIALGVAAAGATVSFGLAAAALRAPACLEGWVQADAGGSISDALRPAIARLLAGGLLASALVAVLAVDTLRPRVRYALAAGCVVADLLAFHVSLNDTAPREALSFQPAVLRFLPGRQWSRVYSVDYSLSSRLREVTQAAPHLLAARRDGSTPGWMIAAAFRSYPYHTLFGAFGLAGSYDTDWRNLYPPHVAVLMELIRAAEGTPLRKRLLQIAAVERVVALQPRGFEDLTLLARLPSLFRGPIHVFGVPDAVPRTYLVTRARRAEGRAALAAILDPEFNPRDEVVLSFEPYLTAPVAAPPREPAGIAPIGGWSRVVQYEPDRVRLETQAPSRGHVVLVDVFDPGWRATVDGTEVAIVRANVAFRAIPVSPGRHTIDLVYRPRSVAWGMALSLLTLMALAAGRVVAGRRAGRGARVESARLDGYDLRPAAPDSP